jgi:hypothetical protein
MRLARSLSRVLSASSSLKPYVSEAGTNFWRSQPLSWRSVILRRRRVSALEYACFAAAAVTNGILATLEH